MPRISVDKIYMQIAYQVSKLSYAERRKVGCVIVKDNQIISVGYNGTPHGFNNTCEEDDNRFYENPDVALDLIEQGFTCDNGCCHKPNSITKREVLHAESNALMKIAKSTLTSKESVLYTTTSPCFECAKLIIQSGVSKVYYCEDYRDMSGIELLEKAGIIVEQEIVWNEH
jgi:dCMP deaminase|tara:strand:- start:55316 stop:55828 length:513 start_codon:yes stop_codon:yes gene_type:complete